ncbi:MAG: TatA/E family twin arginine-targeting protein translocase [Proteobacteria bacterium]|jgi:Tat protein translocase TatB subunit|nr:TatA/E family twin arginine-targeting protein translocase [Pseudomonadota bacterium]
MNMFGIGLPELIVIMVVALIVVGPSKLPELAKSLGKAFNEFRRMADEVKETLEEEVLKEEEKKEDVTELSRENDKKES